MKLSYMKEQCSVLQIFNNFEKKKQMGATWEGGGWLWVGWFRTLGTRTNGSHLKLKKELETSFIDCSFL